MAGPPLVNTDFIPANVSSGDSYVVPEPGTITSWSLNAASAPGQMATFKVYRKVGEPSFYQVIGLDGPHPLNAGLVNPFAVNIPVQAGDVIGCTANMGGADCLFMGSPSDTFFARGAIPTLLGLGDQASFGSANPGSKLNISAVFEPMPPATAPPPPASTPAPTATKKCKKKKAKKGAVAAKKCKKKKKK